MGDARDPGLDAAVPFRFACSRCGHCCSGGDGYAWIEEHEVAPLALALGMEADAFVQLHVREAAEPRGGARRLALRERADGRCTLLEGRNTCRAYEARPAHCRDFPYWPSVMAGGAGFEAARATCPGIAVAVDPSRARTAFERLKDLYGAVDALTPPVGASRAPAGADSEPPGCCLDGGSTEDLYMSALEADYAAEHGRASGGCRLGSARPLGCRLAGRPGGFAERGELFRARLRAIERETGHPVAYGEARALLKARGLDLEPRP